MGVVLSLATKRQLNKQNTEANDKLASSEGKYIGCLPKLDTEYIRQFQDKLIVEQAKINELIDEFNSHYETYLENVVDILLYLKVDPKEYNASVNKLMVGEDGHVWIVEEKGE